MTDLRFVINPAAQAFPPSRLGEAVVCGRHPGDIGNRTYIAKAKFTADHLHTR